VSPAATVFDRLRLRERRGRAGDAERCGREGGVIGRRDRIHHGLEGGLVRRFRRLRRFLGGEPGGGAAQVL